MINHSSTPLHTGMTRTEFRQVIRARRNQLTEQQQQNDAHQLLDTLLNVDEWVNASTIALYLSFDGEIDTQSLIQWCWDHGKRVCVPVLHPFSKGQLLFLEYTPSTPMRINQYNIAEPILNQLSIVPVATIDLIATPLVGFDSHGHRIGMGGGYYDRTLAPFLHSTTGPLALGLAHHCQHVEKLPTESWDVPLPCIVTPSKIWRW
ncbi:5-formyltetrahydrofolate cyclo-ligase [Vibrio sp. qd031]|uniref:5-formyltetrahydrofolate cyclo-ligase n=1 Tax=Vibrio sp. qd031 TaxID=1603038 RepID=UPI001F5B4600|nr:5-formyltetrahydrofolate cyclo-ligase [Vibrio sp. qd031]